MTVVEERRGRVLVVRIDREAKRNAIDAEITAGLEAAFSRLDDDPDLWAGILTGGTTVFSAGTDLRAGISPRTEGGGEYGLIRRRRRRPVIAAVEGMALGGGMELALACDLVVAAEGARFGLPETRRGVVASSGALIRLGGALPRVVANELLIAGRTLSGTEAQGYGLVNRVVPDGAALDAAFDLAEQVCLASPFAVEQTLLALRAQREAQEELGWRVTADAVAAVKGSADMAEGVAAFFAKRPPEWTGT